MKALLVTSFGEDNPLIDVVEKEYESLQTLIEQINKTQRGHMEYILFSQKPFTFENTLYVHKAN